jgi:hypothetical protein
LGLGLGLMISTLIAKSSLTCNVKFAVHIA